MKAGVLKETFPGERRVALVPGNVVQLEKAGFEIWVEQGAGDSAGYPDESYTNAGARITQRENLRDIDVLLQVRSLGANLEHGLTDLDLLSPGSYVVGTCDPLGNPAAIEQVAGLGLNQFSLELIPRITRAQSMDVLSSMATIAGYRAVLLAASELPRIFPLLMTASGTLAAARVFVIGAGVAGLQAIATARRLGAIVQAYDLRPACREQVESLGAKFVELELEADESEDKGGYAKQMGEEFYQLQRELMAEVVAESDVVITTAAIPGRPSPLLVTADAVGRMEPGGVIVDL
ncbi:MAG: NAD(P) transhydrogenase subunit alpha, partial [Marinobacter nauticus]|nr:NAD(P) transhydrogenase subunit alpha [Marinobacter nauticus]